jgi:predicted house-cleaning noncanonical NTP pyrophosphatase (MazG superfamily)
MATGRDTLGKLVRDKIPEIIEATGGAPSVRQLDEKAFRQALDAKLTEEVRELLSAKDPADIVEEAADVVEVLRAIVGLHGKDLHDVMRVADEKRRLRGGFELRLFLQKASSKEALSFVVQDYLAPLESGERYRFRDWPDSPVETVAAGVYTIWEGDTFVYVGYAGRDLTAKDIANADQKSRKAIGLRDRLDHHASGARSGDQFCVYVCDRYVLAALSDSDRSQIKDGDLRLLNARTRQHIRDHYDYRYVPTPDGQTARILERAVQGGALKAGKPLLNPL